MALAQAGDIMGCCFLVGLFFFLRLLNQGSPNSLVGRSINHESKRHLIHLSRKDVLRTASRQEEIKVLNAVPQEEVELFRQGIMR